MQRGDILEQRCQCLREPGEIPVRHLRLRAEAIPPALRIGGVGGPLRIVVLYPAIRAVIDGETQNRQVVGVHHAVHEPHAHPVRDQDGGAFADLGEPACMARLAGVGQRREITRDADIGQLPQQRGVAARGRQFKRAETDEGRRDATDDRAGFGLRMTVIEHVTHERIAGADQTQRARGRHAEVMHRLAAQELADRRAQHRTPIGTARVRRAPGALQLQFPVRPFRGEQFAQRDRTAIAELPRPVAELMPTVVGRPRCHPGIQRIAAEHPCEVLALDQVLAHAQQRGHVRRVRQQVWGGDRGRHHRGPRGLAHLAHARAGFRIAGQVTDEAVVETQGLGAHPHEMGAAGLPRKLSVNRRPGSTDRPAPLHAGRPGAVRSGSGRTAAADRRPYRPLSRRRPGSENSSGCPLR